MMRTVTRYLEYPKQGAWMGWAGKSHPAPSQGFKRSGAQQSGNFTHAFTPARETMP